jgi:L-malate glycosyltransferase
MDKLRVCLISHIYLEELYRGKLNYLADMIELKVISPERFQYPYGLYFLQASGQEGYEMEAFPCWFPAGIRSATRWILASSDLSFSKFQPHIIHIENELSSFSVLQGLLYRKLFAPQAKVIVFSWANQRLIGIRRLLLNPLAAFMRRKIDFFISGNSAGKDLLMEDGIDPERISIFPHTGIDIDFYTIPTSDERHRLRAQMGISAQDFVIGYVGRLVEEKGIDDLLEAYKILKNDTNSVNKRIRLFFVGDGPLKSELSGRHPDIFIVSPGQASNVLPYYWMMDVMVLPSRTRGHWKEQFGRVLVEAMACGVTVVGSNSGEIPNVVNHAGFIFPEGDVVNLSNILKKLFDNPEILKDYRLRGRQRVIDSYSEQKIADQTLETYKKVFQLDRGLK